MCVAFACCLLPLQPVFDRQFSGAVRGVLVVVTIVFGCRPVDAQGVEFLRPDAHSGVLVTHVAYRDGCGWRAEVEDARGLRGCGGFPQLSVRGYSAVDSECVQCVELEPVALCYYQRCVLNVAERDDQMWLSVALERDREGNAGRDAVDPRDGPCDGGRLAYADVLNVFAQCAAVVELAFTGRDVLKVFREARAPRPPRTYR